MNIIVNPIIHVPIMIICVTHKNNNIFAMSKIVITFMTDSYLDEYRS